MTTKKGIRQSAPRSFIFQALNIATPAMTNKRSCNLPAAISQQFLSNFSAISQKFLSNFSESFQKVLKGSQKAVSNFAAILPQFSKISQQFCRNFFSPIFAPVQNCGKIKHTLILPTSKSRYILDPTRSNHSKFQIINNLNMREI